MTDNKDPVVEDRDYQQPVNVGTVGHVDNRNRVGILGGGSYRRSLGMVVLAIAAASAGAFSTSLPPTVEREVGPSRRRKPERMVPRVLPRQWYMDEGGHHKKTPVTEDDHAAVSAAEAKRQRKAKKLAATQSKES
ncbi:hypothetical protein Lauda_00085 [Pseudomonas phage vB_PpuM-Lauda]